MKTLLVGAILSTYLWAFPDPEKPLSSAITAMLGMHLETNSLYDVAKLLGPQALSHNSETAAKSYTLCYEGTDGTVAFFSSDGPRALPLYHLGTLVLASGGEKSAALFAPKGCKKSALVNKSVQVLGHFLLGARKPDILRFFGAPHRNSQTETEYVFRSKKEVDHQEMKLVQTIKLRFDSQGKLTRAQVSSSLFKTD